MWPTFPDVVAVEVGVVSEASYAAVPAAIAGVVVSVMLRQGSAASTSTTAPVRRRWTLLAPPRRRTGGFPRCERARSCPRRILRRCWHLSFAAGVLSVLSASGGASDASSHRPGRGASWRSSAALRAAVAGAAVPAAIAGVGVAGAVLGRGR